MILRLAVLVELRLVTDRHRRYSRTFQLGKNQFVNIFKIHKAYNRIKQYTMLPEYKIYVTQIHTQIVQLQTNYQILTSAE